MFLRGKGKKKKLDASEKLIRNKDQKDTGPRTDASDLQGREPRILSRLDFVFYVYLCSSISSSTKGRFMAVQAVSQLAHKIKSN